MYVNKIAFQSKADHPRMCIYLRSYPVLASVTLTLTLTITLIYDLVLDILKMYPNTKIIKFLGQVFQKLEHEQTGQTHTHTYTYRRDL